VRNDFPYDVCLSHSAKDKAVVGRRGRRIKAKRSNEIEPTRTTSSFNIRPSAFPRRPHQNLPSAFPQHQLAPGGTRASSRAFWKRKRN
jgi:hypothetical protein